jgi:hypothetical protein
MFPPSLHHDPSGAGTAIYGRTQDIFLTPTVLQLARLYNNPGVPCKPFSPTGARKAKGPKAS